MSTTRTLKVMDYVIIGGIFMVGMMIHQRYVAPKIKS